MLTNAGQLGKICAKKIHKILTRKPVSMIIWSLFTSLWVYDSPFRTTIVKGIMVNDSLFVEFHTCQIT